MFALFSLVLIFNIARSQRCLSDASCDFNAFCENTQCSITYQPCRGRVNDFNDPNDCVIYKRSIQDQCRPSTCESSRRKPACFNFVRPNDCICAIDTDCAPHPDPCIRARCSFTRSPPPYAGCVYETCEQRNLTCIRGSGCRQGCTRDDQCDISQFCINGGCAYAPCGGSGTGINDQTCPRRQIEPLRDPDNCLVYICIEGQGRCLPSNCKSTGELCRGVAAATLPPNDCLACINNSQCPQQQQQDVQPCVEGICNVSTRRCTFRPFNRTERECASGGDDDDGFFGGPRMIECSIFIVIAIVIVVLLVTVFFDIRKKTRHSK